MRQAYGLSHDGSKIVLRRFDGGVECDEPVPGEPTSRLLVVDVETTGLDPTRDQIIEFAAADLRCTGDGRIVEHHGTFGWLQDPGVSLSSEITEITGLTDLDLAGKQIPARAEELLADADLIVSHNAAFDWSFCYGRWPDALTDKVWACSYRQIGWEQWGFPIAKQNMLTRFHGFFYDAHRAAIDVEALVKLLQLRPEDDAPTYMAQLLSYMDTVQYRVLAVGTPFSAKDELKGRGYNWDGERRVWWATVAETKLEDERAWLEGLYRRYRCRDNPVVQKIRLTQQWC